MNDCSYERAKEKNKHIKGESHYEEILQNRS